MAVLRASHFAQWLLVFSVIPAAYAWTLGSAGQTCDDVCTTAGKTCTVSQMRRVSSETLMTWVLTTFSLTQCDFDYSPDLPFVTSEPLQMLLYTQDDFYIGRACLSDGSQSECNASETHSERLCCCVGVGEDPEVVCEVPTTTTSTITQTTSTSSTATSTSQTVTTSTSSTMTTTATSTSLSSTMSTTRTTTTITTTTATMTSSTETTTSFLTTTSTVTTQTTTSETVTTQTSTSFTFTSTTMTTTTGMTTSLVQQVYAGDTVLIVSANTGFSIGDIIRITRDGQPRFTEYVEITAFGSASVRRLATYVTFTISPPLENAYGPGASIVNYGPAHSFTGGDPVTYFGGKRWKFWLPLREELLLLATPDLRLYGSVFPGPQVDQQWFDYFMVALPDDTPIATVRVKPHSNRTLSASRRCSSGRFEMLDIVLGSRGRPLKEMRKMEYTAKSVRFEINCRNQAARTEYLYFETPSIVFVITSSHAGVDFRDDPLSNCSPIGPRHGPQAELSWAYVDQGLWPQVAGALSTHWKAAGRRHRLSWNLALAVQVSVDPAQLFEEMVLAILTSVEALVTMKTSLPLPVWKLNRLPVVVHVVTLSGHRQRYIFPAKCTVQDAGQFVASTLGHPGCSASFWAPGGRRIDDNLKVLDLGIRCYTVVVQPRALYDLLQ
ncbi:unnamed protein product [Symbiodinium natans]|uniref:Uncharacterized protein n=1 Tax=Symbiodinium natans TaxID=878477 RepID=A0A812R0X3_9DINO|nr:unnamed protein product [Symbiodinium natans]